MTYEELKAKHPELNWSEAEEINEDDVQAAAELFDKLKSEKKPVLKLTGEDGNAFAILGRASRVARDNNMDWDIIAREATASDYDHLLCVMMKYFDVT